ncbi:lytic transglycosylase domain-containing protein [Sedimentibacter sp. MB31-C6]|uniref:lytic transglycosylase domain-containing protein n=1 Tax=Sedimentibacter sp. MB31-C6 TaxID=3109366 RepID=UPI002DDDB831|nr:transglycosylase SLT domain-containing protein [Sedimentibacter sp. MB36-C1]WSI03927.1 transglycosylase SLT domain-containing protein [Sedimentibacter sp. MB36-C1]
MKSKKNLSILFIICIVSYFMMINMSLTADAEDLTKYYSSSKKTIEKNFIIYELRDLFIQEKILIQYIEDLTKLPYDESAFMIKECRSKNMDPFIVLGVIKSESDFNPFAVGQAGERGLGQLMGNTAKPVAENIGYIYNPENLFDIRYNLKITITQLSYLNNLYNKDVHKTLTAYNRGQKGLQEYMDSGKSEYENLAISEYSAKVLKFANEYKEEFENLSN